MTETGKVREINGKTVIIKPNLNDICFGCIKEECGACGGSNTVGIYASSIIAENPLSLSLKTGQTVEVSAPGSSIFRQAMVALIPPALGFTAGFFLTRYFLPKASEGACAAAGVILLFVAAFVVFSIKKRTPPGKAFTITRIID
jgi:positive regulator of sigma E activity